MTAFDIRPLDPKSDQELDHVSVFSVMTLWESRPEMRVDPATMPHFGFAAHRRIITAGADNPQQQYLVARDPEARIVGHSIVVLRRDEANTPYGYFWSRYVLPNYRRQGLARQFLRRNLDWLKERRVSHADVHIHVDNTPLRGLFESEGFRVADRRTEQWTFLVLRHDLM
ncbi:MAG: GNAT family N-acetyltransferase [Myxococcota bacterium]